MQERVLRGFWVRVLVTVASQSPILMGGAATFAPAGGVTGALPFCVCIAEGSRSAATKRTSESVTGGLHLCRIAYSQARTQAFDHPDGVPHRRAPGKRCLAN